MRAALAACLFAIGVQPAIAETCHEKFVRLYTERNDNGPTKITVIQETKGAQPSKGYHYSDGTGDWMTQTIEPSNLPWSMVRGQAMYASYDKGKSWKKIRMLDAGHSPEAVAKQLAETASTVKNAACGQDAIDGVMHDTVEAQYTSSYGSSHHDKYWINPETGRITQSTGITKQADFESFVSQRIERLPELKLPTP